MDGAPVGLDWSAALHLAERHQSLNMEVFDPVLAAGEAGMLAGFAVAREDS
jgi:hypothetical protein